MKAPGADWNYRDDTFVFVNSTAVIVPEPSTCVAGALLLLPIGWQGVRSLRNRKRVA